MALTLGLNGLPSDQLSLTKGRSRLILLIDQDGVLADFERGLLSEWRKRFPNEMYVPLEERRTFYARDQYPEELRENLESIYLSPGFFRDLPPVEGALKAMQDIMEMGFEVRICTSPLSQYKNCVVEKFEWVEKHLGSDFVKRIIIAKDKTLIRGNVLLDDKPEISGTMDPAWQHFIFDAPYNRHVKGKIRMGWEEFLWFLHLGKD